MHRSVVGEYDERPVSAREHLKAQLRRNPVTEDCEVGGMDVGNPACATPRRYAPAMPLGHGRTRAPGVING